jgi:hypothetical protein
MEIQQRQRNNSKIKMNKIRAFSVSPNTAKGKTWIGGRISWPTWHMVRHTRSSVSKNVPRQMSHALEIDRTIDCFATRNSFHITSRPALSRSLIFRHTILLIWSTTCPTIQGITLILEICRTSDGPTPPHVSSLSKSWADDWPSL